MIALFYTIQLSIGSLNILVAIVLVETDNRLSDTAFVFPRARATKNKVTLFETQINTHARLVLWPKTALIGNLFFCLLLLLTYCN